MPDRIDVTFFIDPGCPFGYSAWPSLTALQWRYGEALHWRPVMIGLAEEPSEYEERGYDRTFFATSQLDFRKHGMPFSPQVKARVHATSPACRAIVAVRRRWPAFEIHALRALQFAQFTSDALLDDVDDLRRALAPLGAAGAVDEIEDDAVWAEYDEDRALARSAEGSPPWAQGKTADGRYTAPSLVFTYDGESLEAGGFQPLEAYDVLLANLAPEVERREAPDSVTEVVSAFDWPLTTAEIAAVVGEDAEERLLERQAAGELTRLPLGDGALWRLARPEGRFTDTQGRGSVRNVTSST